MKKLNVSLLIIIGLALSFTAKGGDLDVWDESGSQFEVDIDNPKDLFNSLNKIWANKEFIRRY